MSSHEQDRNESSPAHGLRADRQHFTRHRRQTLHMLAVAATTLSAWPGRLLAAALPPADTCAVIPDETEGPYPGDGSRNVRQHPNALAVSGIERSDIRQSLKPAHGVADGVPLTLKLSLIDAENACVPLAGYAIYVWHCTRDGNYSMYSPAIVNENYLRGVQVSDAAGEVTFSTIFPGCYDGRWPHIHFEIYRNRETALGTDFTGDYIKVSQLALPHAICADVYRRAPGYGSSLLHLERTSLERDMVFGDDKAEHQMAVVSGSIDHGFVASLTVAIETGAGAIERRKSLAPPPGLPPRPAGAS